MGWVRASIIAGFLLMAAGADAHDPGTSRTMLTEQADGTIHGTFTFAAVEARSALGGDGHVAVDVATDGNPCSAGAVVETKDEDDLVFDEDFACARATTSIVITARFLDKLGGAHESGASIEAFGDTSNIAFEFLRGDHRTIAKELHRPKPKMPRSVFVLMGVAGTLLLVLVLRSTLRSRGTPR
jgi:hypothetical protein